MVKCSVVVCCNNSNVKCLGISFHTFPKKIELRQKWLTAINRPDFKPSKASKLCSQHFTKDDINYTLNRQRLKDDACPFLHVPCYLSVWHQKLFATMPACNIVGCSSRKRKNLTNLTFHRLPRNEVKKKKWLDIIGIENIRSKTKEIFICSLHFEENAFNRTLEIVKLRDDVLPSRHLLPKSKSSTAPSIDEHEVTSSSSKHNAANSVAVESMPKNSTENLVISGHPKYSVTSVCNKSGGEVENKFYDAPMGSSSETESVMSFSSTASQRDSTNNEIIKNQELKRICRKQRNEIRRLKEIVRKQRRKIATFTNILKILTKQRS